MSSKWAWVFGILTAGGVVLSVILFIATSRDLLSLLVGLVTGVMAGSCATLIIVHRRPHEQVQPISKSTRLTELRRQLADTQAQLIHAQSEVARTAHEAEEAKALGPSWLPREALSQMNQYKVHVDRLASEVVDIQAEIDRVDKLTDKGWTKEPHRTN